MTNSVNLSRDIFLGQILGIFGSEAEARLGMRKVSKKLNEK